MAGPGFWGPALKVVAVWLGIIGPSHQLKVKVVAVRLGIKGQAPCKKFKQADPARGEKRRPVTGRQVTGKHKT